MLAGQAWDTGTVPLRKRHSGFPETEGERADSVKDTRDGEGCSRQEEHGATDLMRRHSRTEEPKHNINSGDCRGSGEDLQ